MPQTRMLAFGTALALAVADLTGGPGDDRLVGTAASDLIRGLGGDDQLIGLRGDDQLRGGAGHDLVEGGRGADLLIGGVGDDTLDGGKGADSLLGNGGDDTLLGGQGPDALDGGSGHDLLDGGPGADTLIGGSGADVFRFTTLDGKVDRVLDFDQGRDQLDLGPLLDGFGPHDSIDDFVLLVPTPEGTVVAVDPSGSGAAYIDVALLVGTDLTAPDLVSPDPLPDAIRPGEVAVELLDFVQFPRSNGAAFAPLHDLHHADDGSGRLFVDDIRGQVWIIQGGALEAEPFLDLQAEIGADLHADLGSGGLRSFAFHPDFADAGAAGFGRFYTVAVELPASTEGHPGTPVFRWTESPVATVDVLSEWLIDPADPNRILPGSEREILRVEQWKIGHSTEHIGFDPNSAPGDADHGMLYVSIGDGGFNPDDPDPFRNGQDPGNVYGTMLRIDPLGDVDRSYAIPTDNPFLGDPDALPEIWAYGLRNPQRFSWDSEGEGHLLIANIGEANIEEIDLGVAGANYGWRVREGTFASSEADRFDLYELPPYDASFAFTYPVAQFDHIEASVDSGAIAVTGGFVYRGSAIPELYGSYLFGDIVGGRIFYVDVGDIVPGEQAPIQELTLLRGGQPITLLELLGRDDRVDLRFGQGEDGEIYIITKQDGAIRSLGPADGASGAFEQAQLLESLLPPDAN